MMNANQSYLSPLPDNIPAELKLLSQWVAWKAVPNPKKGKPDKVPMNPQTGRGAITTNPATWSTFDEAARFYTEWQGKEHSHQDGKKGMLTGFVAGVGFVLTAGDPYVGIDLDHCIGEDGTIEPWARGIINVMSSYTELSPSGTGVRIFVKGQLPEGRRKAGDVEMYETGRFLTLTGIPVPGMESAALPLMGNQTGINAIHKDFLAKPAAPEDNALPSITSGIESQGLVFDDDMLLAKIRASRQAAKFNALMNGDITGYSSQSEADMALCGILAFWTGKNAKQMDRLFRGSGLYRQKWDEMRGAQTYGSMTIAEAMSQRKDVYQGGPQDPQAKKQGEAHGAFLLPTPSPPLDAFPASVASLLKEAAAAFGVPLEIPIACFLALLSCLVGRTRLIRIKETWAEAGNLWTVIVAKSGMGKTPAMRAFFAPIYKREAAAKKKYDKELEEYHTAEQIYKKQLAAHAAALIKPKGTPPVDPSVAPKRPQKPKWKQAIANDATPEALADMLQANPKGILWLKDEFASLMLDMDKYTQNKGSTKSNLLSAYDCEPWKTNRASDPERNIFIPKACVGIFGGVQPGVLSTLFQGGIGGVDEESGFLPRIAFIRAVAQGPSHFSNATLSAHSRNLLETIVAVLWDWDMFDAQGNEIERVVEVSAPAKAAYIAWYNAIEDAAHIADNSARLKKLQGQALRLCLLLHCLDAALAGNDGLLPVSEDTMKRTLIVAAWIQEHQEQCWPLLTPGGKVKQATSLETAIMRAIVEQADIIGRNGGEINNSTELFPTVKRILGIQNISGEKIGKAATRLGLPAWRKGSERGRTVSKEMMEEFRATVQPVQNQAPVAVSGHDSSAAGPFAPVTLTAPEDFWSPYHHLCAEEDTRGVFATLPELTITGLADVWNASCTGF